MHHHLEKITMGIFINKGNEGFVSALNGEYVDKTGMIEVINKTLDTERRCTCVTRSRRFGKSMAIKMLCAYYDKSCDSRLLFDGLAAEKGGTFEQHLNKYPVISLDLTSFITRYRNDDKIVDHIQDEIKEDVLESYPDVMVKESDDLMAALLRIAIQTGDRFIFMIDEWDAILREFCDRQDIVLQYVDFLRRLFKGDDTYRVFSGAYMTGILPIKKYKTQSALNNFEEYSVIDPADLAGYFGFTPEEVDRLAENSDVSVEDLQDWYGGYALGNELSMFNPHSVKEAIYRARCHDVWKGTSAIADISDYIRSNFDGITTTLFSLLNGEKYNVDITKIDEDISSVNNKEQILGILIHLGYLSYNIKTEDCFVPNKDAAISLGNAISCMGINYDKEAKTHSCKIETLAV